VSVSPQLLGTHLCVTVICCRFPGCPSVNILGVTSGSPSRGFLCGLICHHPAKLSQVGPRQGLSSTQGTAQSWLLFLHRSHLGACQPSERCHLQTQLAGQGWPRLHLHQAPRVLLFAHKSHWMWMPGFPPMHAVHCPSLAVSLLSAKGDRGPLLHGSYGIHRYKTRLMLNKDPWHTITGHIGVCDMLLGHGKTCCWASSQGGRGSRYMGSFLGAGGVWALFPSVLGTKPKV
jgi:hypothetical protein